MNKNYIGKLFFVLVFYCINLYPSENNSIKKHLQSYKFEKSALIIMDMWDKHWCKTMSIEGDLLAIKINQFAKMFRKFGGLAIHASYTYNTDSFIGNEGFVKFVSLRGCKCPGLVCQKDKNKRVWSKINSVIEMCAQDRFITRLSDLLKTGDIKQYFFVGQHVNECILERPIGAFRLKEAGKNIYIIKDLVNHSFNYNCPEATKKEFFDMLEQLICPLVNSSELLMAVEN